VPLRVSGISPGLVDTEFFSVRNYGDEEKARAVTASMRCLDAADVAKAICWILSTPAHMEVNDGGRAAG
jgi:3-hydroxy acid dehydrogenase/malonic semialdehyde reductase